MKSIKSIALAFGLVVCSNMVVSAQKIGSVDGEGLVYALPEIQSVQQQMEKFQQDTIGAEYTRLSTEFLKKDSVYNNPQTPKSVKDAMEKEYNDLRGTLANWQQIAGQAVQAKQSELLQPLYKKVGDAINAVAKEKGYTYVLTQESVLVAPPADNLNMVVAQKLGIKVNPNAGAAGQHTPAPTPAPAKPKPAGK